MATASERIEKIDKHDSKIEKFEDRLDKERVKAVEIAVGQIEK